MDTIKRLIWLQRPWRLAIPRDARLKPCDGDTLAFHEVKLRMHSGAWYKAEVRHRGNENDAADALLWYLMRQYPKRSHEVTECETRLTCRASLSDVIVWHKLVGGPQPDGCINVRILEQGQSY